MNSSHWLFIFILLVSITTSSVVQASYQGIILPEYVPGDEKTSQSIELALSKALKNKGFSTNINQSTSLCDPDCDPTSVALYESVLSLYPGAEIVIFYNESQNDVSTITAIDVLSMDALAKISLPKTASVSINQRYKDMSVLLIDELNSLGGFKRLSINISGFSMNEIAPVSSFLLSLSANNQIKLIETSQVESFFSTFIPIIDTTYSLSTDIPSTHLINEFRRFWDLQDISVTVEYNRLSSELIIKRVALPYWPSLVTVLLTILMCFSFLFWLNKRRRIQSRLTEFAHKKQADDWLRLYDKSNKPWIRLSHHWINKASYWRQIKKESLQLEKQAKLFFEAGDVNTAKLFITKALNINTNSPEANTLIKIIEQEEKNVAQLNDEEQWIRNKIAKAMINLRNGNYYKALRQAYQAEARCGQQKALKKQLKAIKKLVNKILFQSAFRVDRVNIKLTDALDVLSIGCEDEVFIGRDDSWIPEQGIGVMQFLHKGLSRIGQHAKLTLSADGLGLFELGSTNGTFLNNKRVKSNQEYMLQQDDLIVLAAKSTQQGLAQRVKHAFHSDFYCFEFPNENAKEGVVAEYTKVWSDYMQSVNRTFIIAKRTVYICLDRTDKNLFCALQLPDPNRATALFTISLFPYLSIEPLQSASIHLKGEEVLGKTALQLPAEISYKDQKIQMLANEYSYISEYTKSNIQSELSFKNVEN